ncbi:MAG: hypothetical protein LBF60_01355 [Treponema sp.]|jgi:hypothetical protein|nr:hypothetical protein [Treponema sp.]
MGQMTAEQAAEWGKSLSFEKVWAMFAETDRKMAESRAEADRKMAETERKIAESRAETERRMAESRAEAERKMAESRAEAERGKTKLDRVMEETGRIVAELSKNVGGLNQSLGGLIETLIAARLWEKFPEYGFVCSFQRVRIYDEAKRARTEIAILLSNTDKAMAVEVKRELNDKRDVDDHLKRMEIIRAYPPMMLVNKQLFGAVAGGVVSPNVARYAYETGFYVLELTGESVSLIPPPDGFKPGMW